MIKNMWLILVPIIALIITGCGQRQLSAEEKQRLNNLDATETVRTYFSSGDPEIELYLSSNKERKQRNLPNSFQEKERIGGVDDLSVKAGLQLPDKKERQYVVSYVSRNRSSIGESPGPRMFFVYVAQESKTKLWKIDSVGTGP